MEQTRGCRRGDKYAYTCSPRFPFRLLRGELAVALQTGIARPRFFHQFHGYLDRTKDDAWVSLP